MSKSQFRATTPEDAPAVTEFLIRTFGRSADDPGIEPRHLQWKNWETRPDWPESRGYVMTNGEEIVSCCTVVPLDVSGGAERFRLIHMIDWAADPKVVGAGVTLLKRVGQLADGLLVAGGSEITQKILPALGFKMRGEVSKYVLPLHPWKRVKDQPASARLGAQVGRSWLWKLQAPVARLAGWSTQRLQGHELEASGTPWPRSEDGVMRFERTPALMAYYLRCRPAPMESMRWPRMGACADTSCWRMPRDR